MDIKQKKIEDNDIPDVKKISKNQELTYSFKVKAPVLANKQGNMFRLTESRSASHGSPTVSMISSPESSEKSEPFRQQRSNVEIDTRMSNTPLFRNISFQGSNKLTNSDFQSTKLQNINLTNSIPSNFLFKIQPTCSIRKFKIFNEPLEINFKLPPLSEYYTKSRYQNDMNYSMGPNDPQNKSSNNMNNSIYDFRYSQKIKNRPTLKATQLSNMNKNNNNSQNNFNFLNFANSSMLSRKNTSHANSVKEKSFRDQIRQQQETKEESEEKISGLKASSITNPKLTKLMVEFRNKGVYVLAGFILAIIIIMLTRIF